MIIDVYACVIQSNKCTAQRSTILLSNYALERGGDRSIFLLVSPFSFRPFLSGERRQVSSIRVVDRLGVKNHRGLRRG